MGTLALDASVMGRVNGKGTEDYRVGRQWEMHVGGSYPLTPAMHLLTHVDGMAMGRDDVGLTDATAEHSGGTALYVSPGLRAEVLRGLDSYVIGQFQVYHHSNGPTIVAPYHLAVGLGYALGR